MKNLSIYSLILMMIAVFSCTDLEEEPVGLLAPESMFKTTKDVETAIMGAYGRMQAEEYYGRKLVLTLQLYSDMCDIGDRGTPARRQHINDFEADPNNGMTTVIWPRSYEIISAVNAAIAGAEIIDASETEKNELIAEARFVRAFTYYHLVRLFGDIPYINVSVTDPSSVKEISKTPASEVYQEIIADFAFAKDNLPVGPAPSRSRPSRATAAAYLASVNLTLENWQQAYDNAKWVIDNKGDYNVDLEADYQDLYIAEKQYSIVEPLFVVDFKFGFNSEWMAPVTGVRGALGWSVSVPTMAVYDSWNELDYRKHVAFDDTLILNVDGEVVHEMGDNTTIYPYTEYQRVQRPHIAKFWRYYGNSRGDGGQSDNNYCGMRYGEVLLTAAEAAAELNNNAAAEQYVNTIRARARMWNGTTEKTGYPADIDASSLTKAALVDSVLEERRLELSFEFKRWYDIKRRKLGDEVFKGPNSLEPHDNFDSNKHYLLPIPQDEIDRNENLLPQNPGY